MPKLTLLSTRGRVHFTGGLNWGSNKKNHTRQFDAYIPIHLGTIRANHPFFSPKINPNPIVKLIWDDGVEMYGKFEGTAYNMTDKLNYPKQISSYPHKDTLGKYLRNRMGITSSRRIIMNDLNSYGRTDIDIVKISSNEFHLDFHI